MSSRSLSVKTEPGDTQTQSDASDDGGGRGPPKQHTIEWYLKHMQYFPAALAASLKRIRELDAQVESDRSTYAAAAAVHARALQIEREASDDDDDNDGDGNYGHSDEHHNSEPPRKRVKTMYKPARLPPVKHADGSAVVVPFDYDIDAGATALAERQTALSAALLSKIKLADAAYHRIDVYIQRVGAGNDSKHAFYFASFTAFILLLLFRLFVAHAHFPRHAASAV